MRISYLSDLYSFSHHIAERSSDSRLIHAHSLYELLYMIHGKAKFTLGDTEFQLKPHTLLFIPSDVTHGLHIPADASCDYYSVHFSPFVLHPEQCAMCLNNLPAEAGMNCCINDLEASGLLEMLRQFDDLDGCSELLQKQFILIFLQALIARIQIILSKSNATECVPQKLPHTLFKSDLLDYINTHFTEPITLDSLSAIFYVSKSQLNQTFRRITGTTVFDYIIHKRIAYARQLLCNGLSAQQAGAAAGFGDYTSFYRAYKKRTGCSPNQYKQRLLHP